jgi:hypothetical protein
MTAGCRDRSPPGRGGGLGIRLQDPDRSLGGTDRYHRPVRQPECRGSRRCGRAEDASGQARLVLSAALADRPGWFTPLSLEPASTDFAGQEANQYLCDTQVDFPFALELRADLEARAGGNPSWNTGVNYVRDLARSAGATEVRALYHLAGLDLGADLKTLDNATRIKADPAAVRYLANNITFDGWVAAYWVNGWLWDRAAAEARPDGESRSRWQPQPPRRGGA